MYAYRIVVLKFELTKRAGDLMPVVVGKAVLNKVCMEVSMQSLIKEGNLSLGWGMYFVTGAH